MAVLSNDKRWLVTLVSSNKILAPVLPNIVKLGMEKLYNYINGLVKPCSLETLTYAEVCNLAPFPSPAPSLKDLNFENINNNSDVHGKKKRVRYNYNVRNPVDLAKLYLPNYLAVFSAFDNSMDVSAALRLLGCKKYPTPIYVSCDPSKDIKPLADDVRENVRNPASHFDESYWTQVFFDQCFDKLKNLVQGLPLNVAKTKELLDQLSEWKSKGFQMIVDGDVKDLMEQFQKDKLKEIHENLEDKPTGEEMERMIQRLTSFHHAFLSARFDEFQDKVLSELKDIKAIAHAQESTKSVHPSRSSLLSAAATFKFEKTHEAEDKNPDSKCNLRAANARLLRRKLHEAAIKGQCNVIKALLESGEDVDKTDKFGLTPLHLAAWYGQRAVVKLLLQHGANINAVDRFQKTALQKADRNNHRTIVELLLRNKANPSYNQPPSLRSLSEKAFLHVDVRSGFNQLHVAVFHGNYDTYFKAHACLSNCVQEMCSQKTGNQAKVFPGKTASEIVLTLQEKGEGNVKIENLFKEDVEKIDTLTELHFCRCNNDAEKAVEIVLKQGVDINIPGLSNRTPLLWVSLSASGEYIQTLIDLGADVDAQRTDDKTTPLMLTACWSNYTAADILLKHGADVNIQDVNGWTPLHCSVDNRLLSISQLLIDCGCDINLRSKYGKTPLYLAISHEHKELVKCLLESNADVSLKYKENASKRIYLVRGKDRGKLAWHYVLVQKALLPLFLRRTQGERLDVAYFGEVLESGWGKDPPESVREEIREKENTFHDIDSFTVLHFASTNGSPEIIELLVEHNADINGCDGDGFTPLHLAATRGNIKGVKKLVELNADVNLKVDGNDAADLARMNEEIEIEEFLKPKRNLAQRGSETP